jgi:hypothetical protein
MRKFVQSFINLTVYYLGKSAVSEPGGQSDETSGYTKWNNVGQINLYSYHVWNVALHVHTTSEFDRFRHGFFPQQTDIYVQGAGTV